MVSNPFEIKTPEQNSAQDVVDLFVNVFTDFKQVLEKGHTFLNGPRGSGKSMMFRYIQPDCQKIVLNCNTKDLDYFSVYIPIKLTNINIPDLDRLEYHAETILNEHLLSTYVISNVFASLINSFNDELNNNTNEIYTFYKQTFINYVKYTGYNIDNIPETLSLSGKEIIELMAMITSEMNRECLKYCRTIALSKDITIPYNGSIADFMDFVYPILVKLKELPFFPSFKPFFLLIDDAGYLNMAQTKILNTWVSYRTTKDICFKISTQLDYKTHLTINEKRIDSPHDYSEINISTVYSSSKSRYNERIKEIVEKRIKKYIQKEIDAKVFFPENMAQSESIEQVYKEIKEQYYNSDKAYAGGDAARRYARPEYIRRLQQEHRSGFNYSYAGFDQLVAISSGIIRHFLAPAQEMFSQAVIEMNNESPNHIPASIQDEVVKKYSNAFLTDEFDKIRTDSSITDTTLVRAEKLFNLIDSLGQLFHKILVSNMTERRVFSVALTDKPDSELNEILDMGEQYGYLHKSTIGNKQGTGRNRLYILSRILAPHFKLDPTSFAGYQFMESSTLKIAITDKERFLRAFSKKINEKVPETPNLFEDLEN